MGAELYNVYRVSDRNVVENPLTAIEDEFGRWIWRVGLVSTLHNIPLVDNFMQDPSKSKVADTNQQSPWWWSKDKVEAAAIKDAA